jgi:hypothetical protein
MLADLIPLLTENVLHMFSPERDLFGNIMGGTGTDHRARITYASGVRTGAASSANMAEAAATIWLLDHPRSIDIGDVFQLADGTLLKAIRIERRASSGSILAKVFCNA